MIADMHYRKDILAKFVEKNSVIRYKGSDYRIIEKNKKNIRGRNEKGGIIDIPNETRVII